MADRSRWPRTLVLAPPGRGRHPRPDREPRQAQARSSTSRPSSTRTSSRRREPPADCDAGDAVTGGGGDRRPERERGPQRLRADEHRRRRLARRGEDHRHLRTRAGSTPTRSAAPRPWAGAAQPFPWTPSHRRTKPGAFPEPCNPGETGYGGIAAAQAATCGSSPATRSTRAGSPSSTTAHLSHKRDRAGAPAPRAYETKRRLSSSTTKVKGEQGGKAIAKCKGREAVLAGGLVTLAGRRPRAAHVGERHPALGLEGPKEGPRRRLAREDLQLQQRRQGEAGGLRTVRAAMRR